MKSPRKNIYIFISSLYEEQDRKWLLPFVDSIAYNTSLHTFFRGSDFEKEIDYKWKKINNTDEIIVINGLNLGNNQLEEIKTFWASLSKGQEVSLENSFVKDLIETILDTKINEVVNLPTQIFIKFCIHWGGDVKNPKGVNALDQHLSSMFKKYAVTNISYSSTFYSLKYKQRGCSKIAACKSQEAFLKTLQKNKEEALVNDFSSEELREKEFTDLEYFIGTIKQIDNITEDGKIVEEWQSYYNTKFIGLLQEIDRSKVLPAIELNFRKKYVPGKFGYLKRSLSIYFTTFKNTNGTFLSHEIKDQNDAFQKFINYVVASKWLPEEYDALSLTKADTREKADIIIAFTSITDLNDLLGEEGQPTSIQGFGDYYNKEILQKVSPKPVFFISCWDIMKCYPDISLENNKDSELYFEKLFSELNLDDRFRFLDCNILFHFIPLGHTFVDDFLYALNQISFGYEKLLFDCMVVKEFVDFQVRMLQNSFIKDFQIGSHHGSLVKPYQFHSESKQRYFSELKIASLNGLKWRILLIDDFASKALLIEEFPDKKTSKINKAELIEYLLRDNANIEFILKSESTLEKAEKLIWRYDTEDQQVKFYDVILLDYLLKMSSRSARFGHELIREISAWSGGDKIDEKHLRKVRGPLKRLFFFPISVYPFAMRDSLQDKGINYNHFYW
ncbi:MAG: hypothetical protein AAF502_23545, partial [Bacteroidota bacterium]